MRTRSACVAITAALISFVSSAPAAVTYTDLYIMGTPSGIASGSAAPRAAAGGQAVGVGRKEGTSFIANAVLWTPGSPGGINLHQFAWGHSQAFDTNGTQQVGIAGLSDTDTKDHAILWTGSAASAVVLDPSFATSSDVLKIHGNRQVGYAFNGTKNVAVVWSGTAASAVALNAGSFGEVHGADISIVGDRVV